MRERTFRYNGKVIKLCLSDMVHTNLIKRLTVTEQFKKTGRHNIKCLPCIEANDCCPRCVFKDFDVMFGCVRLLRHVLKTSYSNIALHVDHVEVDRNAPKKSITQMNKLRKCLEGFKKINKEEAK